MFDCEETHETISEYFSPVVQKIFGGTNCSIVAYGNTGSGKTHTMYGDQWPALITALTKLHGSSLATGSYLDSLPGLIVRLADQIFRKREASDVRETISVKYFQIYNEKIIDLMTVGFYQAGQR